MIREVQDRGCVLCIGAQERKGRVRIVLLNGRHGSLVNALRPCEEPREHEVVCGVVITLNRTTEYALPCVQQQLPSLTGTLKTACPVGDPETGRKGLGVRLLFALHPAEPNVVRAGLLTNLLTNRPDLDRPDTYTPGRSPRSARAFQAVGPWLTRKRSLVRTQYRPPATPRVGACYDAVVRTSRSAGSDLDSPTDSLSHRAYDPCPPRWPRLSPRVSLSSGLGVAVGGPPQGGVPGEDPAEPEALGQAGDAFAGGGAGLVEGRGEDHDQDQRDRRGEGEQQTSQPAPGRDTSQEQTGGDEGQHRQLEGQRRAEEVRSGRVEVEQADEQQADRREPQADRGQHAGDGAPSLDGSEQAEQADGEQQTAEDERRVHVRGGLAHAEPADRLAQVGVGLDPVTADAVAVAEEAEHHPGDGEQNGASDGAQGEPAPGGGSAGGSGGGGWCRGGH